MLSGEKGDEGRRPRVEAQGCVSGLGRQESPIPGEEVEQERQVLDRFWAWGASGGESSAGVVVPRGRTWLREDLPVHLGLGRAVTVTWGPGLCSETAQACSLSVRVRAGCSRPPSAWGWEDRLVPGTAPAGLPGGAQPVRLPSARWVLAGFHGSGSLEE